MSAHQDILSDWELLLTFLPADWESKAKELGAIRRKPRKLHSLSDTLRVLLMHLADGCSLRETVVRAEQAGLPRISDVALLKRLKASSEWFRWMATALLASRGTLFTPPEWLEPYHVRTVDASIISEPGSTGTDWRLHYSLDLFSLSCEEFILTDQSTGEGFHRFAIQPQDLIIGDRGYGTLKGMRYVRDNNAHFLTRLKSKAFRMEDMDGQSFDLLHALSSLKVGETWEQTISPVSGDTFPIRLCALRKSEAQAEKSQKHYRHRRTKKQAKVNPETVKLHKYIVLATSLPEKITTQQILELYRCRWQIELAFKRLKGILSLGHLPKKAPEACKAWLHGKIFVALLSHAILDEGGRFSPWGYPIWEESRKNEV